MSLIAAASNPMVFEFLFEDALATLNAFASSGSARMATIAAAAGIPMMGIYVLLFGLGVMTGKVQAPGAEALQRIFKMTLIFTFATSTGVYSEWIIDSFTQVPGAIASELAREGTSAEFSMTNTVGTAKMLDGALGSGLSAGEAAWKQGASSGIMSGVAYGIIAILIWLFVACVCAYGGALVLCSNMGLSIMLAIGPIFIILAMFESTQQLFVAWTRQLITFAVFFIVIAASMTLTFAFFQPFVQRLADAANAGVVSGISEVVVNFVKLVAFCATAILCLIQSVSWASGLAGGVGVAADGHLRRMMGGAARAAARAPSAGLTTVVSAARVAQATYGGTKKAAAYLRGNTVSRS
ncbi:hypothetical protein LMG31884_47640 (plasmid) [Xanthomonas hydrangeae]|uniref:type IV secretion system protein n=1 Tax=Xanthomonas hydrangeae TaxID=2775159 RepID=UPI001963B26C|nr:hypothetical protein LMG31884_47640 [Xanthomonas hydrangeae]CAD7741392.1 hypothetical protein LMG31884_47640 [Xanthomonas hydrangeae]CAD7747896.1 hypothetical protein LMG31887_46190 [Xanthomonas hydrangeae]CAD7747897.1 hypothetical protein LMG31887_46190 [Xanthomonas hydrangeae]CAD7748226.1 hypothetical protein LMG31885_45300 [Xanthomonas hydrangeae]